MSRPPQTARDHLKTRYDIREIYAEALERRDWRTGHDKWEWLIGEVARLQEENERLLEENRQLREEVTLARLGEAQALPPAEEVFFLPPPKDDLADLPEAARQFFFILPETFVFSDFFRMAEDEQIGPADAKEYLRLFLRSKLLLQKGARIEKKLDIAHPAVRGRRSS